MTTRLLSPNALCALALAAVIGLVMTACSQDGTRSGVPTMTSVHSGELGFSNRVTNVNANTIAYARHVKSRFWARLKHQPGVFGMGISWTEAGDVFIGVSVDKNHAAASARIESEVEGVPVRVFLEPRPTLFAKPPSNPLIYMGTETREAPCQASGDGVGTVGCVVRAGNTRYFLSAAHVWSVLNTDVVDPAKCPATVIGTVSDLTPLMSGGSYTMDAAIARVARGLNYTSAMSSGYTPTTTVTEPVVGLAVKKTGRSSGLKSGTVSMIHYDFLVSESGGSWDYLDQIRIDDPAFATQGDSGALVVTETENNPVGMVVAGSAGNFTIATPIQRVLDRFGVTMAQ